MFTAYRRRFRQTIRNCKPKPSLRMLRFEESCSLDLMGFLIAMPLWFNYIFPFNADDMLSGWGVYYFSDGPDLVIEWGKWHKRFSMPWQFTHEKTEVRSLDAEGNYFWEKAVASYDKGEPDKREIQTFPYFYAFRQGDQVVVQEVIATCHVERRIWHRRWFPWSKLVVTNLAIEFNEEVGSRRGSWKGGCVGCGWDMKPNETMEDCLRRMERERDFR